jgi:hypothetical protein
MSSEWEKFQQDQARLRREAEERARVQEQQRQLAEQQRLRNEAAARGRHEQLRREELAAGQESVRQLEQEARTVYPIYTTAESIRRSWEAEGATVQVSPIQEADVKLNDDGTLKEDRSYVGVNISYSYPDIRTTVETFYGDDSTYSHIPITKEVTETQQLDIGIGYFKTETMPPAQDDFWRRFRELYSQDRNYQFVTPGEGTSFFFGDSHIFSKIADPISPEENTKGVQSYFVGVYLDMYQMPIRYTGSRDAFYTELDRRVENIKPSKKLPEAARRVSEFRQGKR